MLCDDILAINRAQVHASLNFTEPSPAGLVDAEYRWRKKLAAKIRIAQRFVLDDEVALAATSVALGRPSSIQAASNYACAPYSVSWFEWSGAAVMSLDKDHPLADPPINRFGVLCETDSSARCGILRMVWSYSDKSFLGGPCISRFVYKFSFDQAVHTAGEKIVSQIVQSVDKHSYRSFQFAERSDVERAAMASLINEYDVVLCPDYCASIPSNRRDFISQGLMKDKDWAAQELSPLCEERSRFKAILILLNTKNGTASVPVDSPKLNRNRGRSKKPALLAHRIVHLRVPDRLRVDDESGPTSESGKVRVHLVRGHFKVRSSGVYWWNSFARGNPKLGMVTHEYRMTENA